MADNGNNIMSIAAAGDGNGNGQLEHNIITSDQVNQYFESGTGIGQGGQVVDNRQSTTSEYDNNNDDKAHRRSSDVQNRNTTTLTTKEGEVSHCIFFIASSYNIIFIIHQNQIPLHCT